MWAYNVVSTSSSPKSTGVRSEFAVLFGADGRGGLHGVLVRGNLLLQAGNVRLGMAAVFAYFDTDFFAD